MDRSGAPTIMGRNTVWTHAKKNFRIDELAVEFTDDKGNEKRIAWASFERGDAVAALIVNTDTRQVILVRQIRPPIAGHGGSDGNLVETAAGMIMQNEEPLQSLAREVKEETGYMLEHDRGTNGLVGTELIGEYYSSPGGSSEKIYLYYVEINEKTLKEKGGGIREHGEFVEALLMPLDEFFDKHERGQFQDAKILIAGHWLRHRWRNRYPGWAGDAATKRRQEFKLQPRDGSAALPPRIVGYRTRDIGDVKDVDIWVNSANTEFLMDSIYHRTLSARIRTLGAKTLSGVVVDDTLQRELARALGSGGGIDLGNVLATGPGSLRDSHNVRRILHVAAVKARVDKEGNAQPITGLPELKQCLLSALSKCDEVNASWTDIDRRLHGPYRSIIMPLIGAGRDRESAGIKPQDVAEKLIPAAVDYLQDHPSSLLEKVYFLAYTPFEIELCDSIMSRHPLLSRIF